jgi:hypothetical protein
MVVIIARAVMKILKKDILKKMGGKKKMQTIERYTKKIGNSLAIVIGKFVCEDENIEEGDKVKIKIIEVIKDDKKEKKTKS